MFVRDDMRQLLFPFHRLSLFFRPGARRCAKILVFGPDERLFLFPESFFSPVSFPFPFPSSSLDVSRAILQDTVSRDGCQIILKPLPIPNPSRFFSRNDVRLFIGRRRLQRSQHVPSFFDLVPVAFLSEDPSLEFL